MRVAGDIGERLLRDAVKHQLDLPAELGEVVIELPNHRDAAGAGELQTQRTQCAQQTEVGEHTRAQALRHLADLLQARADGLLCDEALLAEIVGRSVDNSLETEESDGQALAYLVVEFPRDPLTFPFLSGQRQSAARAVLRLQPVEHLVERSDEVLE